MSRDHIPPPDVPSPRVIALERERARARKAVEALAKIDCGQEALSDLRRLFSNRRGVSCLDTVYQEQFMIVFNALNAGLRDGIL